jgi:anthranilate synthase component I
MNIYTKRFAFDADTKTPIGIFLSLRKIYTKIALLESNDFSKRTESKSFIGFKPIAELKIEHNFIYFFQENKLQQKIEIHEKINILETINTLFEEFNLTDKKEEFCGFFGMFGFEFSHFVEKQIELNKENSDIPQLQLFLFENLIVIDHFKNESYLLQSKFEDDFTNMEDILRIISKRSETEFYFEKIGTEKSSIKEEEFKKFVTTAKEECKKGNVFQLVFSRDFSQNYFGDDFEVYRALRKINPSPYLFYFDFENYRIIGSSPEAQLKVKNSIAEINPIAGTVKKSGNEAEDFEAINHLKNDEKENAEHTMLVDLARNDLSKNCTNVKIRKYKEIQEFSHVYHLVSVVSGELESNQKPFDLFSNTFPAGTLSGTPKPKALELIHKHEKTKREFYGGAIGFLSFLGDINMAIIIRSILSKNNILHYRAGAGVVLNSLEENELQEVENKIAVLRKAISNAELSKNKIII